jgi:hypothetical protein
MNKNFKNVAIHKSSHEQARFISDLQNKSVASTLEEIIDRIFQLCCTYDKEGANIDYETDVTKSQLLISVSGRNRLVCSEIKIPIKKKIVKTVKIIHNCDNKKLR